MDVQLVIPVLICCRYRNVFQSPSPMYVCTNPRHLGSATGPSILIRDILVKIAVSLSQWHCSFLTSLITDVASGLDFTAPSELLDKRKLQRSNQWSLYCGNVNHEHHIEVSLHRKQAKKGVQYCSVPLITRQRQNLGYSHKDKNRPVWFDKLVLQVRAKNLPDRKIALLKIGQLMITNFFSF